jgi:hypothetical protein
MHFQLPVATGEIVMVVATGFLTVGVWESVVGRPHLDSLLWALPS